MIAAVMCSLISLWSRHSHFIDILSSPRSKSNWLLNLRPITVACVRGMPWLLRCRRLQTAVPSSRKNPATAALRTCGFHHPWHDTVEHHISQSWRAFQWSGVAEQPEVPWQNKGQTWRTSTVCLKSNTTYQPSPVPPWTSNCLQRDISSALAYRSTLLRVQNWLAVELVNPAISPPPLKPSATNKLLHQSKPGLCVCYDNSRFITSNINRAPKKIVAVFWTLFLNYRIPYSNR